MQYYKVELNSKIFKIKAEQTFSGFAQKVIDKIGKYSFEQSEIYYTDKENEKILISSETDFQIALRLNSDETPKFNVRNMLENDNSSLDVFRLCTMCEYISKVREEIDNHFQRSVDPNSSRIDQTNNLSFNGAAQKDDKGSLNRSFFKKGACNVIEPQNQQECHLVNFFYFLILIKIKELVIDPFQEMCTMFEKELNKEDHNATKSTHMETSKSFINNNILSDTFLRPDPEPIRSIKQLGPDKSNQNSSKILGGSVKRR